MKKILWFRRDLRIEDNPALVEASKGEVIPVYIKTKGNGAASDWYLHHALSSLENKLGHTINYFEGEPLEILLRLSKEQNITSLYWNRLYEPDAIERDTKIKSSLKEEGIEVESFESYLLIEPWRCLNQTNKPYQVFTPFWKNLQKIYNHQTPLSAPEKINCLKVDSLKLAELNLLPRIKWAEGFAEYWNWKKVDFDATSYSGLRDFPAIRGTSRTSPALHFGEVSPRMLWEQYSKKHSFSKVEPYLRQLGWREFAHHLLFHFPNITKEPLRQEFKKFPWNKNSKYLEAWKKGVTGYPIVDAGMRELWTTGWMHNRVRMIVGSFLVKNLLQHWHEGADWFWDTLVDADLANNTMGWQWISGCGADAAPYFRVFNPVLQGEKFDAEGVYVKKWVPELRNVPAKWIHKIWDAPEEILSLAKDYPKPIVDLADSRDAALDAYAELKSKK